MFGWLDALRAWWTKVPELTELPLDSPEPDAALAARMAREATEYASERGVDFSTTCLSALDSMTDHEPVVAVGAYIGEVMVRSSARVAWARNERGDPGLAVGAWLADPFEWVEWRQSAARAVPAVEYVSSILTFAADPTDETSTKLGWHTRFTPGRVSDGIDGWVRRRRHRP